MIVSSCGFVIFSWKTCQLQNNNRTSHYNVHFGGTATSVEWCGYFSGTYNTSANVISPITWFLIMWFWEAVCFIKYRIVIWSVDALPFVYFLCTFFFQEPFNPDTVLPRKYYKIYIRIVYLLKIWNLLKNHIPKSMVGKLQ